MKLHSVRIFLTALLVSVSITARAADLATWQAEPEKFAGAKLADGVATFTGASNWSYLRSPEEYSGFKLAATITIAKPATEFRFFGQGWSVWPDHTYGDQGFEASLLLRSSDEGGYRVQLSHKLQEVALVKYPRGGYLQSVPCDFKLNTPHQLAATLTGNQIVVTVDGVEKIRFADTILSLAKGRVGIGASSQGQVRVAEVVITPLPTTKIAERAKHQPNFATRSWLGGRLWVFDGAEPILLLPTPQESYINNVKLRPGYKPQLSWNSHWDIQNQGAYPEGMNKIETPIVSGGGRSLTAKWTGRQKDGRFTTETALAIGYDSDRDTYTYDVDTTLTVGQQPFEFRYGMDFEHHTPLDPFNWQYLIVRRENGQISHRPLYPSDPGPMYGVEQYHGARVWYGRHNEKLLVAPAVEYKIAPEMNKLSQPFADGRTTRQLHTAVCAAFYDTAVAFAQETAPAGTKVHVKYRYTGYEAAEADALFAASSVYDIPTLDPNRHYIFADEWPKLTFSKFVPLSKPWWSAHPPFKTGHNQRPTYELAQNTGVGSGCAIKLGPGAFAKAPLALPAPLAVGRYVMTAKGKLNNVHGPGGRIEFAATKVKAAEPFFTATHFVGSGTQDWKEVGCAFELADEAAGLLISFGNAGTGEMLLTDVEFKRLEAGATLPAGVADAPNTRPAATAPAIAGALADYRLVEGQGLHTYDFAAGPMGVLELANLDWVVDGGHRALRFADNTVGRKDFSRSGPLFFRYLSQPAYQNRQTVPAAIAGHHGGAIEVPGLTIAAWIKPAPAMGVAEHKGRGAIAGVGARRFVLLLQNEQAPYKLAGVLNVNDTVATKDAVIDADRWQHVAMACRTESGKWRTRLYVDGKLAAEGLSEKFAAPATMPPSLILGAEIFYLHDAWYRGLIGRTLVVGRALNENELAQVISEK